MVIQRIQSVYLLIVTILMAVYSFMDVAMIKMTPEAGEVVTLFGANYISFFLSLLVAFLSLVTIFKYKKMNLQIALCSINVLLTITQLVVLVVGLFTKATVGVEFFICNCMPIFAIIFLVLSITAIKRDKKILSSYDRIR